MKDLVCSSTMTRDLNQVDPSPKIQVMKDLQLTPMKSLRGDHESLETLFLESQTLTTTDCVCVSIATGGVTNPESPPWVSIPAGVPHVLPIIQLAFVVPLLLIFPTFHLCLQKGFLSTTDGITTSNFVNGRICVFFALCIYFVSSFYVALSFYVVPISNRPGLRSGARYVICFAFCLFLFLRVLL